ncbi:MAG: hypothetical protein RLZZ299_669 [Pseudomonadota bacterium]|jgi:N-acetylglucosaminyl-diphospho-decaprenol L-rhamnosyltransferase
MDAMSPRIAAVVVTHRGGPLLAACLDSLRAQTAPPDELRVVVSGPHCPVDAPSLQLGENVGYARAVNAGAAATRGEVLLLNDDTRLDAGCLAALRAAWRGADRVYQPRILLAGDAARMDNTGHGLFPDGFAWARGRGGPDRPLPGRRGGFSGAAALVPRQAWDSAGGFDGRMDSYGEDVDLSLRLLRRGIPVEAVPEARVYHHLGATYGRLDPAKLRRLERNRVRAAVRSLPASLVATLPAWTAARYAMLAGLAAAGRGPGGGVPDAARRAALAGLLDGLRDVPTAWRDRCADRAGWTHGERAMLRALWEGRVRWEDLARASAWDAGLDAS